MFEEKPAPVALATGAGRGLGRAVAEALTRSGMRVVVNDIGVALDGAPEGADPASEVVAAIRDGGGEAIGDHHSVTGPSGGVTMVESALAPIDTSAEFVTWDPV